VSAPARRRRRAPAHQDGSPSRLDEILEVAAEIFHEQGYAGTTMRDIAERVGMLNGSLYYYIDSKEDLLFKVVHQAYEAFSVILGAVEGMEGDTLEKLYALVYAHVTGNAEHYRRSSVYFQDFHILPLERQRVIIEFRDRHDRLMRSLLQQGQEEGLIPPDVDVRLASIAILTMVSSVYRWYRPGGSWDPDYIARGYASLVLDGLTGGRRRAPTGAEADAIIGRFIERRDALRAQQLAEQAAAAADRRA
jgi:AcrR family transcriptional regulator